MKERFSPLFEPLTLPNGSQLDNRFVLSPMVTNSSTKDGYVTQDDVSYALRRAASALYKLQERPMWILMVNCLNMVLVLQRCRYFWLERASSSDEGKGS